jgi:tRNA (guanine-N7-)-methyltransferase
VPEEPVVIEVDINKAISPSELFGRQAPLEIDLGCGKGRFLSVHASRHPERNFIGIERKLKRVRKVEKKINRLELSNARLIRIEAAYFVEKMLPDSCLDVLYIFYPDPWPKRRHNRRRLFAPQFMDSLTRVLSKDGIVHLATDHLDYFDQMTKVVGADDRFVEAEPYVPDDEERTEFETTFLKLGKKANRLSFTLR